MNSSVALNWFATACFFLAVMHTLLVSRFQSIAARFKPASSAWHLFHLLGEVEVSFGFWATVYICGLGLANGYGEAVRHLNSQNFTEPAFVFVIMSICSTRPILELAKGLIHHAARLVPGSRSRARFVATLTVGPLLGSAITEPAAMTVTALILFDEFFNKDVSPLFKYVSLGLLFVAVSIGGTLAPFAAPPVLMVARLWAWDFKFMLTNFGWKAALAIVASVSLSAAFLKKEFIKLDGLKMDLPRETRKRPATPPWVWLAHAALLFLIILVHTEAIVFLAIFMLFLGLYSITQEYQDKLRLREGLMVAFFLGGIVVLGEPQQWWLAPLLKDLSPSSLFTGSILLTSFTDNAALTYLGTRIGDLTAQFQYALVAGAVTGGGLTVIANAPNPVGYGILNDSFGPDGISPLKLAAAAAPFTLIAALAYWFL
jgi:hypothetical protein